MTSDVLEKGNPGQAKGYDDDFRRYLSEIRQFPRLTPEEERALAQRCAQGDEEAIRHMVNSNLRLVASVAREYAGCGVPLLDLIQEGSIGLLTAAKKFDYTLDFRFSTYATKWIRQSIGRCLANRGAIRIPAHTAERMRKVMAARANYVQKNGAEPTPAELAQACGIPEQKVQQLLRINSDVYSLDAPLNEDETTLALLVEDEQAPQPYEALVREELSRSLNALMDTLEPRQRRVLRLYYGMEDGVCHSFTEIAGMLGVSKERVRQIEKQAIAKLQQRGEDVGLEDFLT